MFTFPLFLKGKLTSQKYLILFFPMNLSVNHISTGNEGENRAIYYLEKKGYQVLEKNYRFKRAEIDIIVSKENVLVFVEVKTRRTLKFGLPEESVNSKKSKNVIAAAENYIHETGWEKDIRFDVISIALGTKVEIEHIKDVFF